MSEISKRLLWSLPREVMKHVPRVRFIRQLDEWYGAPTRHYHTLTHIQSGFDWIDIALRRKDFADAPAEASALRLAILFHDAIYDPARTDNEAASAVLARQCLGQWQVPEDVHEGRTLSDRVASLIELTGLHGHAIEGRALGVDERLMLDIDLAILASPAPAYAAYAQGVAAEYAPVTTPEEYKEGRTAFLRGMLGSSAIYRTGLLGQLAETEAKRNMEREIVSLRTGQPFIRAR